MAQTLGTAIEQLAAVGTPSPVAASFPARSAPDALARQPLPAAAAQTPAAAVAAAAASGEVPPPVAVRAVIESINAGFLTAGKSLQLSVDAQSQRSVVILRDTRTGAVIGQFPTKQLLRLQTLLASEPPHALIDLMT